MSANERPWTVKLRLYPGANPSSPITGWGLGEDISDRILFPDAEGGQPIGYRGGRRGVSAFPVGAVDFAEMDLTLGNGDGRFSHDKVDGPYWPDLDINTPIRMGTVVGYDDFNRSAGASLGTSSSGQGYTAGGSWARDGAAATVALSPANTITRALMDDADAGDFDATVTCWAEATATGAVLVAGLTQHVDNTHYVLLGIDFKTDGNVAAKIHRSNDAGITNLASVDPIPGMTYAPDERIKIRAMRDGQLVAVKVWKEAGAEPAEWTASAAETSIAGGQLGMIAWRLSGNTNAGTQYGFDDFYAEGVEFTGTVNTWPSEWDMTGELSWAAIKCSGILRRLRQAKTNTLQSPLRRQLPFFGPSGYWPLEDGPNATSFGNAVAGRQPAKFTKMRPAADDSLPGALTAPTFSAADGTITAFNQTTTNTNGFAVAFLAKIPTNPLSKTRLFSVRTNRGTSARIDCSLNFNGSNGLVYIDAVDGEGNATMTVSSTATDVTDWTTDWFAFCLIAERQGPDTLHTFLRVRVGDTTAWFAQGSFAGGLTPWARTITVGGTSWDGTSIAHLWVGPETLPFVSYAFFNAASGFDGELASDRIERIGEQAGIPVQIEPGDSEPLGPQPRLRPVEIMQTAADSDAGILFEHGSGLRFRPRSARRNQPVLLELSKAAGHIAEPPKPVRDDQRLRNKIVVTRDGGSSATSEDLESIERHGEYEDPATVYVQRDAQLQDHADWRRFLGTRRGMRWSGVKLDFTRNPDLLPVWRTRTHAFRYRVTTGLTQVTGSEPDLLADGWSASLDPMSWTVDLESSRADVWDVGNYDDPVTNRSRYGPSGAHLDQAIDDDDLALHVDTNGETWGSGVLNGRLVIGGEDMTPSAIGDLIADACGRTTANGLGSADTGGAYTVSGGVAANYAVSTGMARITNASTGTVRQGWLASQSMTDVDLYWTTAVSATALTQSIIPFASARLADASNCYRFEVTFNTGGQVDARIRKVVAGVDTSLAFGANVVAYSPGTLVRCRGLISGSTLRMKIWLAAGAEPAEWNATATDTSFTGAGFVGIGSFTNIGNTNTNPESRFDDLVLANPRLITLSARSVNGPVKSHAAGAAVGLAGQKRYGF